eukprot:CAMPEP_0197030196 /NCGR_PEP_ID=MMETSP1384-20130603/9477_1 /TAXON_ID=29189 /ORGANISM="Ammonia sp." /LENGTH=575 /DNA_ID=CAMNT_0042459491 /DNA_START=38 /DNA_END=1765 /DNA_ORIENTATION=+
MTTAALSSILSVPESTDSIPTDSSAPEAPTIYLDGNSLTPELLYDIGFNFRKVGLTKVALKTVSEGRKVIDDVIKNDQTVYGVNTGFGLFSQVRISKENLKKLQLNLIRSHAAGIGPYLSLQRTRMLLALRINVLAKGHSGITVSTLSKMITALNHNLISCVPIKGTVGASGDLAQLAHLALGLLGEGEMWHHEHTEACRNNENTTEHIKTSQFRPMPASKVLELHQMKPLQLQPKEGLALINGTQFIASLGCEALIRGERVARQTDVVAAMSLEALKGTPAAYHPSVHQARPHDGQMYSANILRNLLHNPSKGDEYLSQIANSHHNCGKVQDAYTLRCAPQVHGIVHDTLRFCRKILTTEINSATDNPMVFANETNPRYKIISGGNFHGEYPAKVLDYLAIAVSELGNMSERRIERLNNPALSELPAFLVAKDGGLNNGFMIPHCTAAALVSENKVLCHPSSVDSLSTSAAKEDHVSMGGFAARKALQILDNVETIIAIELMCAAQGIDLLRPLKSTLPLEELHKTVREQVPKLEEDRFMKPDMEKCVDLIKQGKAWDAVKDYIPIRNHSLSKL